MFEFVSPDQAGERLVMRCHQYCGCVTDFVHRQSSGYPGCARRWWFPFYEELHMCVFLKRVTLELSLTILKKKLALMDELKEMSSDG